MTRGDPIRVLSRVRLHHQHAIAAILTGEGTRTHTGTNEEQMRVRDPPDLQIHGSLVLVPPALRRLHRRVALHFKVDHARLAAVRAAVPLTIDVDADDRVLGNHFHVDVLAAAAAVRICTLSLNAALEERHHVVLAAAASLRFRLPFQDM